MQTTRFSTSGQTLRFVAAALLLAAAQAQACTLPDPDISSGLGTLLQYLLGWC